MRACAREICFFFASIVSGAQGKAHKYEKVKNMLSELARTHEVYLVCASYVIYVFSLLFLSGL